jgi:hypothetical protein
MQTCLEPLLHTEFNFTAAALDEFYKQEDRLDSLECLDVPTTQAIGLVPPPPLHSSTDSANSLPIGTQQPLLLVTNQGLVQHLVPQPTWLQKKNKK